ncbi:MAG: DUF2652 domain-containing protein [Ignavibacteria bacterium]
MSNGVKTILLVADISGYTKFMKSYAESINHAKQIIVRLLKSIINASKPPLKVAELEGDAVFFYASASEANLEKVALKVKEQLIKLFAAFKKELEILSGMNMCKCDACVKVGELKLKQVLHSGDVEFEKIHKREKLFGLDVIVVHRMLKNSVPSNEYVMMSRPVYTNFVDFYGLQPEHRKESFEGIGEIDTVVFYPENIIQSSELLHEKKSSPSLKDRIAWMARIVPRTFLDLFGIVKIKGTFNNLPS